MTKLKISITDRNFFYPGSHFERFLKIYFQKLSNSESQRPKVKNSNFRIFSTFSKIYFRKKFVPFREFSRTKNGSKFFEPEICPISRIYSRPKFSKWNFEKNVTKLDQVQVH